MRDTVQGIAVLVSFDIISQFCCLDLCVQRFIPTSEPKVKTYYLPVPSPADILDSDSSSFSEGSGNRGGRDLSIPITTRIKRKHPSTESDQDDKDKRQEPLSSYPHVK